MKHRWAALAVVLALGLLMPRSLLSQGSQTPRTQRAPGSLGQNYPNPFNPETTIPFAVGDVPTCADQSTQHRVTLRIYNVLAQLVAIPVLQGGSSADAGTPLENRMLTCGQYTAFWNGKFMRTDREVASGIYLYRLDIDGRPFVRKMIVLK